MALSVYVHIPYCLQRCRYCDFTTFATSDEGVELPSPETYVGWVLAEIRNRRAYWPHSAVRTLYFGGGTPSLISPELIVSICTELANVGLKLTDDAEVTLEINPATVSARNLDIYMQAGINRFSVGAQSFNDALLKSCGRKHSAEDTRMTLRLLRERGLNYSFDLLFALPSQTLSDLRLDLREVADFSPPHLSAYCLTVPESHPMSLGRPPENEQLEMFSLIEAELAQVGLQKYEISNFAKPGFESRHNLAYWQDVSYWGLGLSSHSYLNSARCGSAPYGVRFWNPKTFVDYEQQALAPAPSKSGLGFIGDLPSTQREVLELHESLTDTCHIFLRTQNGLPEEALRNKFPPSLLVHLWPRLEKLNKRGLVEQRNQLWSLTETGQRISNKVFEELTFLKSDALTVAVSAT